jgi:single-stranded DNA-binding protein
MLDDLNSILIEGTVDNPVLSYTASGAAECRFNVTSKRRYKDNEIMHSESFAVPILALVHLAETCAECLTPGRGVRIVGRLSAKGKKLFIRAEHVEFKPTKYKIEAEHTEAIAL